MNSKEPKIHRLKTTLLFFDLIVRGKKLFDIRKNDRDFQTGDVVHLTEWDICSGKYTGQMVAFKIGYILGGGWGLEPGYCAFMLVPLTSKAKREDKQQIMKESSEELRKTYRRLMHG